MTAFKARLSQLEARLQSLVEGGVGRLLPAASLPADLAHRLVEAMRGGVHPGPVGEPLAPNLYILSVHTAQAGSLSQSQTLLDALGEAVRQAGSEAGLTFPGPIVFHVEEGPELAWGEVRVQAQDSQEDLSYTTDLELDIEKTVEWRPQNAFLIVDGTQIVPLSEQVLNIGRRSDNHLVVDDPRVSRLHAQLRLVKGRYVIFDLDSRGGTWVNGVRIHQQALYPGDVISLSGVPLVYGQDESGQGETQEYSPGAL
jgi:hypothetical protein